MPLQIRTKLIMKRNLEHSLDNFRFGYILSIKLLTPRTPDVNNLCGELHNRFPALNSCSCTLGYIFLMFGMCKV